MCNCNQVNLLIILILGILLGLIIAFLIGIALFLGLRTSKAPAPRGRDVTARRGDRHQATSSSFSSSSDSSADDMVHEKAHLIQKVSAPSSAPPPPSNSVSEKKKRGKPISGSRSEPAQHDDYQTRSAPPPKHPSPRRDYGRDSGRDRRDVDKKHRSDLHGACSIL